jgi:hypothetical protein
MMVPLEAFSTEAPQSSSAFCSGWDGGTQWDSLSSKILSLFWALAATSRTQTSEAAAAAAINARLIMSGRPRIVSSCRVIHRLRGTGTWSGLSLNPARM